MTEKFRKIKNTKQKRRTERIVGIYQDLVNHFKIALDPSKTRELVEFLVNHNYTGGSFERDVPWLIYYYCRLECRTSMKFKAFSKYLPKATRAGHIRKRARDAITEKFNKTCSNRNYTIRLFREHAKKYGEYLSEKGVRFGEKVIKDPAFSGNPASVLAGLFYILLRPMTSASQHTISHKFGVKERTVGKWYHKIWESYGTKAIKDKIWI